MDINGVIALSDLKPAQPGRVVSISTKTVQHLLRLMQAGVLPNACVNVIQRDGRHVLFYTNYKELAVDQEIASGIFLRLDE